MTHFDVIVIGCGPAGQKAAIKCAKVGRKVAIVDERQVVGGQCLHVGTIPSKTFRAAIIYLSGYYERRIYGEDYRVKRDLEAEDLIFRCNSIIRREINIIHEHLERNRIAVLNGTGHFVDDHTLRVVHTIGTDDYTADHFIVCTGATSNILTDLPFNTVNILNTDDILKLSFLPKSLMVIGGGVIGLEYASMFSLLGVEVQVVSRYPTLLPWVDVELVDALQAHMAQQGVRFLLEDRVAEISAPDNRRVTGTLTSGTQFEVEMLLYAAPRKGNTADLDVAAAGLAVDHNGYLKVNENYQTEVPHIYAAGDVIGWPSLASTSIDQGRKAANHLLGVADVPYEPLFPYGIYTFPDMSTIGATEEQLRKEDRPYEVGIGHYRDSARGQIIGDEHGLVKLLFDPEERTLLGCHIIGSEATELIHIAQAVMINGGKIDYFIDTVFNYPTLAEVYKIAALNGFNKTKAALPGPHL
ncbi:Si-specific NAD(P)(+) transhydrogenase [bacterium]|nr:Si-specific NAD(P)(+) transhydrogenase [bacterium]